LRVAAANAVSPMQAQERQAVAAGRVAKRRFFGKG
jgi:hypothetical protein